MRLNMWQCHSFLASSATGCEGQRFAQSLHLLAFKMCSAAHPIAWEGEMREGMSLCPLTPEKAVGLGA